jgi:hypothetical protein
MELNKLVFAGLAAGCLAAAAGGGYLAARQSPVASTVESPAPVAAPAAPGQPVAESEGVIEPPAAPSPELTTPAPAPRRGTPPVRTVAAPTERRAASAAPRPASTRAPEVPPTVARAEAPARPGSPAPSGAGAGAWEVRPPVQPERAALEEPEPVPAEPPAPELVDLVVPADSVLGLQIERKISSETARVEDRVEARLTRDLRVGDRVAIPAGSVVQGSVIEVERGGRIKEKARLGIRFHTVVMADGTRLPIRTDTVVREGASPASESAAKIGGAAVGGAILGAILGGGRGAVIGGTVGAAGGTAATMAGDRNAAVLNAGSTVSVRVQQPVTVTVEKKN